MLIKIWHIVSKVYRIITEDMINKTIIKSFFLNYVRGFVENLPLCVFMCLLGVIAAMGNDMWINETTNSLMGYSLLISLIALCISNFFIVENARESRKNNKKKMFSEYCARFSSNQNLCKVAEWLLAIAEFDSNGVLVNVYPKRLNDDKGRTIVEPTFFQKKCFGDFIIELIIQIDSKQLEKEDVKKCFSIYASIFYKVLQQDWENVEYD